MEDKKSISWKYNQGLRNLIANIPGAGEVEFDMTPLMKGMTASQELGHQYFFKQWAASSLSKLYKSEKVHGVNYIPSPMEKASYMKKLYRDAVEYGFMLVGEGQIKVASPENQATGERETAATVKANTRNMATIQRKLFAGTATEEEIEWLKQMLDKYDPA